MAKLVDKIWHYIDVTAEALKLDTKKVRESVNGWFARMWDSLGRGLLKFWVFVRSILRKVDSTPLITKLQILLLTIILLFIFWQFTAYEMSQTTFISINIIMAVCLTSATAFISVRSQRGLEDAKRLNIELAQDLERRTEELDQLKTDLFELRNKNRRQSAIEKGSKRFVETVRKMKSKVDPEAEKLQYIIDALEVCFDITGAVAFARKDEDPAADAQNADAQNADGEAAQTSDANTDTDGLPQGTFEMAGRFGLSDEPPLTVFSAGNGILGQVVANDKTVTLDRVPADYLQALSGLGKSRELNVYALPLTKGEDATVVAVIEVASFEKLKIVEAWEAIEQQLRDVI